MYGERSSLTTEQFRWRTRKAMRIFSKQSKKAWVSFGKCMRRCTRKARLYIQAYCAIAVLNALDVDPEERTTTVTLPAIEKFKRDFKTHRCALDFDSQFIRKLTMDTNSNSSE